MQWSTANPRVRVQTNLKNRTLGILHNDRIYEVDGVNVTSKSHLEIVDLIKQSESENGKVEFLVVDEELDEYYKKNAIKGEIFTNIQTLFLNRRLV